VHGGLVVSVLDC